MWQWILRKVLGEEEELAPRGKVKRYFQIGMMFLLFVSVFFMVMLVAIIIAMVYTDNTGFQVKDPKFPLYKNTIFEQCSTSTPSNVNCTTLFWSRQRNYSSTHPYKWVESIAILSPQKSEFGLEYSQDGETMYDWCDLMSCLKDYKIIPSKPRPTAFGFRGYNRLQLWGWLCVSAFGAVWFLRNTLVIIHRPQADPDYNLRRSYEVEVSGRASSPTPSSVDGQTIEGTCKGIGVLDWLFWIYDIGSLGIWVYSYAELLGDRFGTVPVSMLSWITPWQVTVGLFNHPFACHHPHSNKGNDKSRTKPARILISVLAVGTFTSWILCAHLRALTSPKTLDEAYHSVYECLESEIAQAPGTTICSPELLCSKEKEWMFADYRWDSWIIMDSSAKEIYNNYLVTFVFASIAAWTTILFWGSDRLYRRDKWFAIKVNWRLALNGTVIASLFVLIISSAINGSFVLDEVLAYNSGEKTPRQAVVTYDVNCTTVHVHMSDWRYYLDVDGYDRATRIVHTLFNS